MLTLKPMRSLVRCSRIARHVTTTSTHHRVGERGILIRFGNEISLTSNQAALDLLRALDEATLPDVSIIFFERVRTHSGTDPYVPRIPLLHL